MYLVKQMVGTSFLYNIVFITCTAQVKLIKLIIIGKLNIKQYVLFKLYFLFWKEKIYFFSLFKTLQILNFLRFGGNYELFSGLY